MSAVPLRRGSGAPGCPVALTAVLLAPAGVAQAGGTRRRARLRPPP